MSPFNWTAKQTNCARGCREDIEVAADCEEGSDRSATC